MVSALSSSTNIDTAWLVDSGACRYMTSDCRALTSYKKKKFTTQVELGDDSTYKIEGVGSTSLQLVSGTVLHIDDILYVPGLTKNLLSVAGLEEKGYKFLIMDKKFLLWEKNEDISSTVRLGLERKAFTRFLKIPPMLWYITQLIHVNFAIEGLDTFTTKLSQDCRRWLQVCQKYLQNMKESTKDVL